MAPPMFHHETPVRAAIRPADPSVPRPPVPVSSSSRICDRGHREVEVGARRSGLEPDDGRVPLTEERLSSFAAGRLRRP